jgi:NADH-quinone oxidoreductase subunit H
MGFALFSLGEYANIILISSLTVLLFFGGWLPIAEVVPFVYIPGVIWFASKTLVFIMLFIWARAAFPRYR